MQKKLISAPHTNHKILHKKPSFEAQLFAVIAYAENIQRSGVFKATSEMSKLSSCSKFKKFSDAQKAIFKIALEAIEAPPTDLKAVCEKVGEISYYLSQEVIRQVLDLLLTKIELPKKMDGTLDHAEICKDLLFSAHSKHLELTMRTLVNRHPEWISSNNNLDKFLQEIYSVVKQDSDDMHHLKLPEILPTIFTALRDSVSTENFQEIVQENIRQILNSTSKDKLQLLSILFSVFFESKEPQKELFKSTFQFVLDYKSWPLDVTSEAVLVRLLSQNQDSKHFSKSERKEIFYDPNNMSKLTSESRLNLMLR